MSNDVAKHYPSTLFLSLPKNDMFAHLLLALLQRLVHIAALRRSTCLLPSEVSPRQSHTAKKAAEVSKCPIVFFSTAKCFTLLPGSNLSGGAYSPGVSVVHVMLELKMAARNERRMAFSGSEVFSL